MSDYILSCCSTADLTKDQFKARNISYVCFHYAIDGEEYITVKYVQKSEHEGFIKLVSQNQHHADKEVEMSRIRAIALIKASIRMHTIG